jgi:hypothetical protein
MFWYLNKQTNDAEIFGSVAAIVKHTDLKPDNLYRVFSRLKLSEYESEHCRIVKTAVKRAYALSFYNNA